MIKQFSRSLGLDQLRGEGMSILYLSLMAALILMSYGLTRGPSETMFLSEFSHTILPGLWIEVGFGVIGIVAVYNYLLRFFNLREMFSLSFLVTGLSLIGIMYGDWGGKNQIIEWAGVKFPWGQTTLLRIWCDLYIVVFVEIFWSIANTHFPLKKATHIYGLLCAGGTIGSICGNALVASKVLGTPKVYVLSSLFLIPLLGILNYAVHHLWKRHKLTSELTSDTLTSVQKSKQAQSSLLAGLNLVMKSRYLIWILALVMLSQITVSLIDYEYKHYLKEAYANRPQEEMSAFQGWMYLSIDIGSLICQLFTGWIILRIGIVKTHLSIPLILFTLLLSVFVAPTLLLIATARSVAKFITYSIFKSAKELLYVPLSYEEQTQGKAVIDMMVYRQAKILASIMLLPSIGLVTFGVTNLTLGTLVLWLVVVFRLRVLMNTSSVVTSKT